MDPAHIFRQGLGSVPPRQSQPHPHPGQSQRHPQGLPDLSDDDGSGQRVAHTLTACCRCRQRKTRCDPTLPRCLPCERSGSTCEYLDTTKGRKINRYYVVRLQDKVRTLEAELRQYTDDGNDYPCSNEDIVRPGGMIRVGANDETPRYLGPSSGIAMSRLLMEEAKRYTESHRISELIPEVRARSQARMQSIQMTGLAVSRKKSYPVVSDHPAETLPKRETAEKLVEVYKQKSQLVWPLLHEKDFERDLAAVYDGDADPYKNFITRMAIAISLQKLDIHYAGLADSYYVAAMRYAEALIRPKDLKTLQCLIMIGQYSLLTPTRTPFYYVIGLATRICLQEGLADEQTITAGYNLDPKTLDMRRRLVWIVATAECGLSYHLGRPSGFATSDDRMDVEFFSVVDDAYITPEGIQPGPPSERKLVAIHIYKTRQFQAEIRRTLYEKKRPEPKNDSHPWYGEVERKLKAWLEATPENPSWFRTWFTGYYHHLKIALYRPSPQVPQPSPRAAAICFESSAVVLEQARKQLETGTVSVTWIFLLTLNLALDALLWATSYAEVRLAHPRGEVDEMVNMSLLCLDRCAERWPGTAYTSQLYGVIAKACLQSYDSTGAESQQPPLSLASPSPSADKSVQLTDQPAQQQQQQQQQQSVPFLNPPQFGFVFDSPAEAMNTFAVDPNFPPHPTFRSNSIFCNPASESSGRRFSYFPPDSNQSGDGVLDVAGALTVTPEQMFTSPSDPSACQLPTPPESLPTGGLSASTPSATFSPTRMPTASTLSDVSAHTSPALKLMADPPPPPPPPPPPSAQPTPTFDPSVPQTAPAQRPLPTTTTTTTTSPGDWFTPPAPFLSPYNFGPIGAGLFNDAMPNTFADAPPTGLGLQNVGLGLEPSLSLFPPGRQGSLTHEQQMELMNVLETEGAGDIDAFLSAGSGMPDGTWY
ncbi:hypothetical protein XA68_12739 [Ophiocordyceps unilateralis]|uniref:Zn(2)-C6 fungal-type domain-containing protein n=1 Tax=Ophiocordyceps unilateralis TaxID=268505 RepID=A0A2A9PCA3_OPHUN|nr:hypothetical protein XA68_12739 [Ophiocordyceps unilateralis]